MSTRRFTKMPKKKATPKRTTKSFSCYEEEFFAIQKNAEVFAEGNVSEWIRYAAINYVPKTKARKKRPLYRWSPWDDM
jgi:hypothetical protein